MRKLIKVSITALAIWPAFVLALGLGDIKLESNLNEPLRASITLLSTQGMQSTEIIANLASETEFRRAGIEKFFYLNAIRFNTVQQGNGLVLELRTRDPIKEPFVNFLVELNWPAGKLVREYTLLLDPPIFQEGRTASRPTTRQATTAPRQRPAPSRSTSRVVSPRVTTDRTVPVIEDFAEPAGPQGGGQYQTSKNETAWSIAKRFTPRGANIYQTLMAIYETNPDAFDGDVNKMKNKAQLRIPTAEEIRQIQQNKQKVVTSQIKAFEQRRGRIDVGQDGRLVDNAKGPASDRLKLLTPDAGEVSEDGAGGAGQIAGLRRRLGEAKEASETLRQENTELRDRLDSLAEQVDKMQRLISLKDEELAALTAKLEQDAEAPTVEGDGSQFAVDEVTDEQEAAAEAALEAEAEVEAAKEESPTAAPVIREDSMVDKLLSGGYLYYILGGLGVFALLGGAWFFLSRRMSEDEFDEGMMAGDFEGELDFGQDFGGFDDDDSIGEEMVDGDLEDMASDPVSEADVFIAYRKYDQAEQVLLAALEDNPDAADVHQKLFECYAEAKEQEKFQNHVPQAQACIDADSDFEQTVKSLYENAWPGESLDTNTDVFAATGEEEALPSTDDIFGDTDMGSDDFSLDDDFSVESSDDDFNVESSEDDFSVAATDDFSESTAEDFASDDTFSMDSIESALEQSAEEVDMGGEDNPFADDGLDGDLSADLDDLDFQLDDDDSEMGATSVRDGLDTAGFSLEENFEEPEAEPEPVEVATATEDNSVDFDSGTGTELDDDLADLDDIDIDFEQDIVEQLGGDMEEDMDDDFSGLGDDLSLDDSPSDAMDDIDEASTKLDLARAYIDMGDSDGARDILNEVMSEGNSNQQSEARALLEKI